MENSKEIVFVLDCDGTLTDGKMYYTKEGKTMKAFGCDDFDALRALSKKVEICFITADKKGFDIVKKRAEEMEIQLHLVSNKPKERWDWIVQNFIGKTILFMGDGINDWYCLEKADMSFTVKDALDHILEAAQYVINRRGGDRAVAQACLMINGEYGFGCFADEELG